MTALQAGSLAALLLVTSGCSSLAFYSQSIGGQLHLLLKRRDLASVIGDERADPRLRSRLEKVLAIREFAVRELALTDSGSYRSYVSLDRPYVVWNVVAAPEFSLEPLLWCFPVAGCVSYRGYFSRRRAERFADRLRSKGHDVAVEGVAAYSTLGWFEDPVLSTFIHWPEADLAALLFHELAHERIYVKGDTEFNESYATVVEREGLRRWLRSRGSEEELQESLERRRRRRQLADLLGEYRERLQELYRQALPVAEKRRRKAGVFADLRLAYTELEAGWSGSGARDGRFAEDLNNAHLVSVNAYHRFVAAFEALLAEVRGDLGTFHEAVDGIARLAPPRRWTELERRASSP